MKTNVHRFSLDSYFALRDAGDLSAQEAKVFDAIGEFGPMTREEIAARVKIKESSVCGRVKAMLERGVLVVVSSKDNPTSGREAGVLDLNLAAKGRRV